VRPWLFHLNATEPAKKKKVTVEKKKRDEGPPPPNLPAMAVCNAAGALHHLTFVDEAKSQVSALTNSAQTTEVRDSSWVFMSYVLILIFKIIKIRACTFL
jgi:hypothetical protein